MAKQKTVSELLTFLEDNPIPEPAPGGKRNPERVAKLNLAALNALPELRGAMVSNGETVADAAKRIAKKHGASASAIMDAVTLVRKGKLAEVAKELEAGTVSLSAAKNRYRDKR